MFEIMEKVRGRKKERQTKEKEKREREREQKKWIIVISCFAGWSEITGSYLQLNINFCRKVVKENSVYECFGTKFDFASHEYTHIAHIVEYKE